MVTIDDLAHGQMTFTFQSVEWTQRCEARVPSDHYDDEERSSDRGFIDDDPITDQYEGSSDLNDDHLRQQTPKSGTDPTALHKRDLYSSGQNDQEAAAASSSSFQRGARTRIYSSPSPPPPPNPYLDRNDFFGLNEEKPEKSDDNADPPDLLPDTQRMPLWEDDVDDVEEENNEDHVVVVEQEEQQKETETDDSPTYTVQQVADLLNSQRKYYQQQTSTSWKGKGQGKGQGKGKGKGKGQDQGKNGNAESSPKTTPLSAPDVTLPVPPFSRTHLQPPPSMPLGPKQLVLPPPPPGSKVSSEELTATEVAEALEKLSKNRMYISDVGDLSVSAKADSMSNVQRLLVRKDSSWKDICAAITSPSEFFKLKGLSDQVRHYKKMSCCIGSIGREKEFHLSYTIGESFSLSIAQRRQLKWILFFFFLISLFRRGKKTTKL